MPQVAADTGYRAGRRSAALVLGACTALSLVACTGAVQAQESPAPSAPAAADVTLVDLGTAEEVAGWTTVNDPVMGGRSTSVVAFEDGGLRFSGSISLDNNGGFASTRGPVDPEIGPKATGARSLRVRAVGDGKTYLLKVRDTARPWSNVQRFATEAGVPRTYDLPVARFEPVGMRLDPAPDAPPTLDPSTIDQVAVYILDKQQGPFAITVTGVDAAF